MEGREAEKGFRRKGLKGIGMRREGRNDILRVTIVIV